MMRHSLYANVVLRSRFVFCVIISLSTNDPVTCQSVYPDLRGRLVVEATDWAMVHHAAEVRGFTCSAEARVNTEVVAAGLAHVAVRILHDHHHLIMTTCHLYSPVYTRPGDSWCMDPPLYPGDRSTDTGHPGHWPQPRGRRGWAHTGQASPHIAAGNTHTRTDSQGPPDTRDRILHVTENVTN